VLLLERHDASDDLPIPVSSPHTLAGFAQRRIVARHRNNAGVDADASDRKFAFCLELAFLGRYP
jgi:hypothetical protein